MLTLEEIYTILEQAFAQTQRGAATVIPFSRDVQLTGQNGVFDSLDTMLFVDLADDLLSQKVGREVDLVDADSFSRPESPFASMQSLAEYVAEKLKAVEE